jgi:hypothetical protein
MAGNCFWIALTSKIKALQKFRSRPRDVIAHLQNLNRLTDDVMVRPAHFTEASTQQELQQFSALAKTLEWPGKAEQDLDAQLLHVKHADAVNDIGTFSAAANTPAMSKKQVYDRLHEMKQHALNIDVFRFAGLSEAQKVSNYDWVADEPSSFSDGTRMTNSEGAKASSQSTDVGACDPWLCLICQVYRVSIDHIYNHGRMHGNDRASSTITYRNARGHTDQVSFSSNTGHFQ